MHDADQDATDLGTAFADMFGSAGGAELARAAENDPTRRHEVAALLETFGTWDIHPLDAADQLLFASVVCEQAGGMNLPYPVAERLAAVDLPDVDAVCVVDTATPVIPHGGLGIRWAGTGGDQLFTLAETSITGASRIAPFAVDVEPRESLTDALVREREALHLLLSSFTLLGMCEAAAQQTYDYVTTRHQFGSPIASFQGLRFSLTDVETSLQGARELGRYGSWSFSQRRDHLLADALVFRVGVLEAADITFARCHQAYGAIGLCDETDLSWLSRHSRVLRHAPWGITRTERRLLEESASGAVVGPFSFPTGS